MRLPVNDPGVASERTAFAWIRTGVVFAMLGGLMLTVAVRNDRWDLGITSASVSVMCGCIVGGRGIAAYASRRRDQWCVSDVRTALVVTVSTLIAACTALVILALAYD
ncbi:DUF202 domain-containing protein [Bradyrhizobium denitrificans]